MQAPRFLKTLTLLVFFSLFAHFSTAQANDVSVAPITTLDASDVVTEPLFPSDSLNQDLDIFTLTTVPDGATKDLWDRIRKGFAIPDLNNPLVATHSTWYSARPEYMQRTSQRASRYLFHVLQELEKRKMPTELALLPFIESSFNPQAYSRAKAAGMWQFIPSTGRDYNLKQNVFRDGYPQEYITKTTGIDYKEYAEKLSHIHQEKFL
jgi:membrane-bound lytic murein transglycosylase D